MTSKLKVNQITNIGETGYITTSGTSFDLSGSNKSIILPAGSTEERPAAATQGALRFNTSTYKMEYYTGSTWLNTDGTPTPTTKTKWLVYSINTSASNSVANPNIVDLYSLTESTASGVSLVPYSEAFAKLDWKRAIFTSTNKPYVRFVLNDSADLRKILRAMLSPYSNWANEVVTNGTYAARLDIGSSIKVGDSNINWQHNNGGGEFFDILTLGNSGTVWSTGMYWGQIDDPSNYGGFLNTVFPASGSGGGNTGDKLLIYLDTEPTAAAGDYVNYLQPNGPLGNAQNFPTTYSGSYSSGWGAVSNAFNNVDVSGTGSWPSYGIQLSGTSCYVQVDLGTRVFVDYMFAIGYANGSHWSSANYLDASNDGTTWTRVAEWSYHNGSGHSTGYLVYPTGAHVYSNTINNMSKWIPVVNTTAYRYWRLGGTAFNASNGYQLIQNWALLRRKY